MYQQGSVTAGSRRFFLRFNSYAGVQLSPGSTTWSSTSDERYKTDIKEIPTCCSKISQIKGYYFKFIGDPENTPRIGLLAQEIEKVFPEVVETTTSIEPYGKDGDEEKEVKSVRYTELIPIMINSINELIKSNMELKARIEILESQP